MTKHKDLCRELAPSVSSTVVTGSTRSPADGLVEIAPDSCYGTASGSPAHAGSRPLAFVNSVGRRLLQEIRQTCRATYEQPVRLVAHAKGQWQRRSLNRAFVKAQLALGQRMFSVGIDDGELGAQIRALDEKVRWAVAAKTSCEALKAERVRLVMALAAAALADKGPLPGADAEYARACEAEAALQKQDPVRLIGHVPLGCPHGRDGWVRATIGYAGISGTVTLASFALSK
jgi:hypothetical protein